jgi:tripartite-type tricarboxylate transporter receptor subunit TctC
MRRSGILLTVSLVFATVFVSWLAFAAEDPSKYPSQPVRVIVPFAPGGASDLAIRITQVALAQALGQQIVIENRAGAAGNVGMDVAARAAPDGYTIFLGNSGTIGVNPALYPYLTVKPDTQFIPVSLITETPSILIANSKFPPNTLAEMIAYVKERPGKINFASPGSGSADRLLIEKFRKELGLDMNHVPYKGGGGAATADVLAGHVELLQVTATAALPYVRSGRIKAFAISTKERIPAMPNVPTFAELGYPQYTATTWQGMLVPAGTPQPIIDKIHAAAVKAMSDPQVKERFAEYGVIARASDSPDEFRTYVERDTKLWGGLVVEIGAQPD